MRVLPLLTTILALYAGQVWSQGLTASRPIPGYSCMRLNLSHDQITNRQLNVPVFEKPSSSSSRVGQASATVIVRSPLNIQNGFAEMMFLDGRQAWIAKDMLMPYATAAAPNARCTPSIMSDGKPGFG